MSKFIILTSDITDQQRNAFSKYITEQGFGYWHWMPDAWLIYTSSLLTAMELRDALLELAPKSNILVDQVETKDWAINSPRQWHDWLQKNWSAS